MPKLLDKHKVYVIGGNSAIEHIFMDEGAVNVHNIDDATILCFTGGSDVSPDLYGEERHPTTHCNPQRDAFEKACFERGVRQKLLMFGICRGGQFLNVMNGGSLWQDVDKHAIGGEHPVMYEHKTSPTQSLSRSVQVTSTHHQMMIPNVRAGGQVWGWAGLTTRKSAGLRVGKTGPFLTVTPGLGHQSDCEIVYYHGSKSLCFQPHPEYNSKSTRDLFFTCIERVLAA